MRGKRGGSWLIYIVPKGPLQVLAGTAGASLPGEHDKSAPKPFPFFSWKPLAWCQSRTGPGAFHFIKKITPGAIAVLVTPAPIGSKPVYCA